MLDRSVSACLGLSCSVRYSCNRYMLAYTGDATRWAAYNACISDSRQWRPNMKIHIVPIEPMLERYSAQWLDWIATYLIQNPIIQTRIYEPYDYLHTQTTSTITHGQFLDVYETNSYKMTQLQWLIEALKSGQIANGDTILLLDGWFPGIETIAYIRDCMGLDIKIVALFHAGTYDPHDYLTQKRVGYWGQDIENGWFKIYDKVLVATHYHRQLLCNSRCVEPHKVQVVFFPMFHTWNPIEVERHPKLVVFPHRHVPEKQYDLFDKLANNNDPNLGFIYQATHGPNFTNKEHYYRTLNSATYSISMALQETWGIAMIESVLAGCIPIVPDRLSYSELYPTLFKYPDVDGIQTISAIENKLEQLTQIKKTNPDLLEDTLKNLQEIFLALGAVAIPTIFNHCYQRTEQ